MNKMYSIMSLNVHDFTNTQGYNSIHDIIEIIKNFDIIALQEVYTKDKLFEITKGYNYTYNNSTLIMCKFPIKNIINEKINECFTSLIISLPNKNILVNNIHLNHINENIRIKELNNIYKIIDYYKIKYSSILLGDFNSLTYNDYNLKQINDITNIRNENNWEIPVYNITEFINCEWFDCGEKNKKATCKFNTRIDYIYTKNINVISYDIIKTMPDFTDHNLIYIKFTT